MISLAHELFMSEHYPVTLNVALFEIEAILEKREWNLSRNCTDLRGHHTVIKRFST